MSPALAAIGAARSAAERAEAELTATVLRARQDGATWHEIGDVLGISRQAAFKRFGRPVDPASGEVGGTGPLVDPVEVVEGVFRLMASAAYDVLHRQMTFGAARQLSRARLSAVWSEVLASVGELEGFAGHQVRDRHGVIDPRGCRPLTGPFVARAVLLHEAGEMVGHVSVHRSGKVDGVVIAPVADEADLPF